MFFSLPSLEMALPVVYPLTNVEGGPLPPTNIHIEYLSSSLLPRTLSAKQQKQEPQNRLVSTTIAAYCLQII